VLRGCSITSQALRSKTENSTHRSSAATPPGGLTSFFFRHVLEHLDIQRLVSLLPVPFGGLDDLQFMQQSL